MNRSAMASRMAALLLVIAAVDTGSALAIEPFSIYYNIAFSGASGSASFFVPSNKILVEQSLSGRLLIPAGNQVTYVELFQNNGAAAISSVLFPEIHNVSRGVLINGLQKDVYTFESALSYYYQGAATFTVGTDVLELQSMGEMSVSGYLIPALTGDFNANGTVDAADYVKYRHTLGQTGSGLAADGNDNNSIEPGDYNVWRSNFGLPNTATGNSLSDTAVPEPATTLLILAAMAPFALIFVGRIRRAH